MVSDEQLLEDLREFADEIGETPSATKMRKNGPWHDTTYRKHFGSWNNALNTAGLKLNVENNVSDEQLLEDLKDFADEIGETPSKVEMEKDGPWSEWTYRKYFDTWNNSLKQAGLEINEKESKSDDELLEDLKDFADEIGEAPTYAEMKEDGPWSSATYLIHFGSWNNALKQAGLAINTERHNVSDEQLLQDLKAFADEIGKTPTGNEMRKNGPWDRTTYENHFGTWNSALKQVGLRAKAGNILEIKWDDSVNNYYGESYKQMREKAKERDERRCRACSSEEKLHVHHIKPRRLFENPDDSNTLDNLITLCHSCHPRFENEWVECDPDEFAERAKASLNK